jgi:uncharacterized protein DUF4384
MNSPALAADISRELMLECGKVELREVSGGHREVAGFVRTSGDLQRAREYAKRAGVEVRVDQITWPACEAMIILGEALKAPVRPKIRVLPGQTLKIGDYLTLEITAPDYPAYLYAVYLQADGTAVNLLPRDNLLLRAQQPPGWKVILGNDKPRFKVSPPAGDEAVLVVAARSPIQELEALEKASGRPWREALTAANGVSQSKAFLAILRSGLERRPDPLAAPREITAAVLQLTIKE